MSNETTFGVCQLVEAAKQLGVPPPVSIQNDFRWVVAPLLGGWVVASAALDGEQTLQLPPGHRRLAAHSACASPARSLLDRRFESHLAEACAPHNYNIGLLPYGPLAGGTLTDKYFGDGEPGPNARHVKVRRGGGHGGAHLVHLVHASGR